MCAAAAPAVAGWRLPPNKLKSSRRPSHGRVQAFPTVSARPGYKHHCTYHRSRYYWLSTYARWQLQGVMGLTRMPIGSCRVFWVKHVCSLAVAKYYGLSTQEVLKLISCGVLQAEAIQQPCPQSSAYFTGAAHLKRGPIFVQYESQRGAWQQKEQVAERVLLLVVCHLPWQHRM